MHFDVFNGDADGICALHQLRLCAPRPATLVTGVKRDIRLLERVDATAGDSITVLDISLAANRPALDALLARGVTLQYFDHHQAGTPPVHPALELHLDTAEDMCTGLLVDRYLGGRQRRWAIVAAFGDGLPDPAHALGAASGMTAAELAALQDLGAALAYNAYGEREADLVLAPAALYRLVSRHADPVACRGEPVVEQILATMRDDLAQARAVAPWFEDDHAALYLLPDAPWSRRVRGALGYALAQSAPARAHAVLSPNGRGGFVVSVRAPRDRNGGADRLCANFAGGGGRAIAAGVDDLPAADLQRFAVAFRAAFA